MTIAAVACDIMDQFVAVESTIDQSEAVVGQSGDQRLGQRDLCLLEGTELEVPGNVRPRCVTTSSIDRSRNRAIPSTSQTACSAGNLRRRIDAVPVAARASSIHDISSEAWNRAMPWGPSCSVAATAAAKDDIFAPRDAPIYRP